MSRILIVAIDSASRSSLRTLFEAHHEFMVCGDTGDAEEAIKKANKLQPGLIILDSALASINGFETAKALNSALPSVRLFLLMDEYSFGAEKEACIAGSTRSSQKTRIRLASLPTRGLHAALRIRKQAIEMPVRAFLRD
jgi:DNA-binding NarL/FixJ family response regulator